MRDVLLLLVFTGILPFAMRRTWVAVLLWTWVSVMNPHKLAWGFALDAPFAAAAAGAAFISLAFNQDKLRMPWRQPEVISLLLFVAWMCVTTVFAYYPGEASVQLIKVLKIQVMTVIALAAIRERKHIELFVWVNALSIGFYGFKGGLFTILSGGGQRVWGPPGGFIEGNNEIGLAMVMTVPLLNYLRMVSTNRWVRYGLLALMLLTAIAALGTQSRGAFLAVAVMSLVLWFRSRRKILGGIFMGLAAVVMLALMSENWEARMRTIENYQQDSSAMGRINAWTMAFNLANSRFSGGGFVVDKPELFARFAPDPLDLHAAHSIFFQVLGEHGYVGLVLFVAIGAFGFRTASWIRKQALQRPETLWAHDLAGMIQVSMVGYAVGGAFLSLSYFDLPYNIMVMLVACRFWLLERRWETEKTGAFNSAQPVGRLLPQRASPA
jgi:probable O-glycosylation ligase (exosortase A-associated)